MTLNERKQYKQAIDNILNTYDAFYFENKYGDNTHQKDFDLLSNLKGQYVDNALGWIRNCYDCAYKNEMNEDSPFAYLNSLLEE